MKLIPALCLAAVSLLTACGSSNSSSNPGTNAPIRLPEIPKQIADCDGPAPIDWERVEDGLMPVDAMFEGWGKDRRNLVICDRRHDNLVAYYGNLQTNFSLMRDASGFPRM